MVFSIILRNSVYEFQNAKVARPRLLLPKFIFLLPSLMFGIFVDRFEHSSDLCAMASKVLWPLRATPETPTVRSGTSESCFQHFGSFCRVLCTCVRKMRSRVRRVCGARARTSWSFLPSFQSPGAAAAPPRRDLK